MTVFKIAFKSWGSRKLAVTLAVISIALGSALFLSIEKIRSGVKTSFSQTISGTDLIVGPRSSTLNLLLNTVFHVGVSKNMIKYETYQKFKDHPKVAWAVPISFGDSYRGYRVIGTTQEFFEHYKFRKKKSLSFSHGKKFEKLYDAVIGASVAESGTKQLKTGDSIILAHGIADRAFMKHENNPFKITGILDKTNTPVDRSVLVSLEALEAIHKNWSSGGFAATQDARKTEQLKKTDFTINKVSAFFLACNSRADALALQREVAEYDKEPLSAALPGMTLLELWRSLGNIEKTLFSISILTALVSLLSMLIAVLISLQQRRREIAILRSLGAGPMKVFWLLTLESGLLALLGLAAGFSITYGSLFVFQGFIEMKTGVYIAITYPGLYELIYATAMLIASGVLGIVPGTYAYRMTLRDGFSMKL